MSKITKTIRQRVLILLVVLVSMGAALPAIASPAAPWAGVLGSLNRSAPIPTGIPGTGDGDSDSSATGVQMPAQAAHLPLSNEPMSGAPGMVSRMEFVGANDSPSVAISESSEGPGATARGQAPGHKGEFVYPLQTQGNVYSGVAFSYSINGRDRYVAFDVAPGSDLSSVRWRYRDGLKAEVAKDNSLQVQFSADRGKRVTQTMQAPTAFQLKDGKRSAVAVRFAVNPDGTVTVEPNAYDKSLPLTIESASIALSMAPVNTFVVTRTDNEPPMTGTLLGAIATANGSAGPDAITFNIPGGGVQTIAVNQAIPTITDDLIIDGTTQPGFFDQPVIEINGAGAGQNVIGFFVDRAAVQIRGLAINRFTLDAIRLSNGGGSQIQGNMIGTDPTGLFALPNGQTGGWGGVVLQGSPNNLIGGTTEAQRNVISGNRGDGIFIALAESQNNIVTGNYIGTDSQGIRPLPNGRGGILLGTTTGNSSFARNNRIGGPTPQEANVVTGSSVLGLQVAGGPQGSIGGNNNLVQGNLIGTGPTGAHAIGSNYYGVLISNAPNTRFINNVVSGSTSEGIEVEGALSAGTVLQGNKIGTDITGNNPIPNGGYGIIIGPTAAPATYATNVLVGGTQASERNIISANGKAGIIIFGANGNRIFNNMIGTGASGLADPDRTMGNRTHGIAIAGGSDNHIGGTGANEANVIANNIEAGVGIIDGIMGRQARGNLIRKNRIESNRGIAIDLGVDGPTLNDIDGHDDDSGPNDYLNAPQSLTAEYNGSNTKITGIVTANDPTSISVDIYVSDAPGPLGTGQGQQFLGTVTPMRDGTFELLWSGNLPKPNLGATATADRGTGATSEFSQTRAPMIFVPGVSGSELFNTREDKTLWVNPFANAHKVSVFATDTLGTDITVPDVLHYVSLSGYTLPIYGPYVEMMSDEQRGGYRAYNHERNPNRFTNDGCDYDAQKGRVPNFFVFPYDWRQDNAKSAQQFKDFMGCVQKFHPNAEVDVTTHSMGSLVVRRAILDNPDTHHVQRLITIGAPWLGAPKMPYVLESGDFVPFVSDSTIKHIMGSLTAPQQLAPSRFYQQLNGRAFFYELGWDFNGRNGDREAYAYEEVVDILDERYGCHSDLNLGCYDPAGPPQEFFPGSAGKRFHDHSTGLGGQDDWRQDSTGVKYYHIYGIQNVNQTIGTVNAVQTAGCFGLPIIGENLCTPSQYVKTETIVGDITVPLISSSRIGTSNGIDLNASGAQLCPVNGPEDDLVDHVQLPNNPWVMDMVMDLLLTGRSKEAGRQYNCFRGASEAAGEAGANEKALLAPQTPVQQFNLSVYNASEIALTDREGNTTGSIGGDLRGIVPNVTTYELGDNGQQILMPAAGPYTVTFNLTGAPLAIELLASEGMTPTRAIRYTDLGGAGFPEDAPAIMLFAGGNPGDLLIDADMNGSYETVVPRTRDISGAAAGDTESPVVTATTAPGGPNTTLVTLAATDAGSGVANLFYSVDGSRFNPYTGTFAVNPVQNPIVYAFADDNVGNRGGVERALAADLEVNMTDLPDPVAPNNALRYSVAVRNNGPAAAPSTTLTDTLPADATFISATSGQGTCLQAGGTVNCSLGQLGASDSAHVTITISLSNAGTVTNSVTVDGGIADTDSTNNTAIETTLVSNGAPTATGTPSATPTPCQVQTASGSVTNTDPVQNGRMARSLQPSACDLPRVYPGTAEYTRPHYDVYTYTNTSASESCITVTLDATGCPNAIFSAAYLGQYDPANISNNYGGDSGIAPNPSAQYSFSVPAGATYSVVVNEITEGAGCASYTLTVSNSCQTVATATPSGTPTASNTPEATNTPTPTATTKASLI